MSPAVHRRASWPDLQMTRSGQLKARGGAITAVLYAGHVHELPRGGAVVSWANAWLLGQATLDDAATGAMGTDALHRVVGVPREPTAIGWTVALGRLRAAGVTAFRLVVPVSGDPRGLTGPLDFNAAAIDAGEAVLAIGTDQSYGLIPTSAQEGDAVVVRWDVAAVPTPGATPAIAQVSDAEHELLDAIRDATATLEALDLASGRDQVAKELAGLDRQLGAFIPAPGLTGRAARLVVQAARLRAVVDLSLAGDGAAITASEAAQRRQALEPLAAACRHTLMAAYSAATEPPKPR